MQHVALIMDGNGRWAKGKGLPRYEGHKRGRQVASEIVKSALKQGIPYLTLYAFSTENWGRPKDEVSFLWSLLQEVLLNDVDELVKNGIQLRIIGDRMSLSPTLQKLMRAAEEKRPLDLKMTLLIALNYGGRQDILGAVKQLARHAKEGVLNPDDITLDHMQENLTTHGVPDPDLIVRTSGEKRLSNFLLWQSSYTELHFSKTLWPEFTEQEFEGIVEEYKTRERRFGHASL